MKQDKIFWGTLLFIFVKGFIIKTFGNFDLINLLADVLVICCAVKTPKIQIQNVIKITGRPIIFSLFFFFLIGIIGDIVNSVPIKTSIWGIKNFLRFFLLTYSIIGRYKFLDSYTFKKLVTKLFYLNLLAITIDFFAGRKGDSMGGIFLGNGDLAIFLIVSLFLFTSDYFVGRKKKLLVVGAYVSSFIIAMLAEIKFLYLIIPMCLYLSYVLIKKMTIMNITVFILSCMFIVPSLKYALSFYYNDAYIEAIFNEEERDDYLSNSGYNLGMDDNGFNRNTSIENVQLLFFRDNIQTSLVGFGLGSASNSKAFGTWIADKYRFTGYFFFTSSFVLIETGWIGYILFISIYLFIMLRFLYYYIKSKNNQEKYWAAIGTMMGIMTFMFIWYNSAPYVDYYLPFMLWGFCFLGILKNKTI